MIQKTLIALFILGLACSQAMASISIERDVTLTDAQGGTIELSTSGQSNAAGSDSVTTALFTAFQSVQANRSISGEVVRSRSRDGQELGTSYSGILESTRTDEDGKVVVNVIEFDSLVINRSGDGPDLSGVVIFNGETFDAAELSQEQALVLRRTLRFFRFA